MMHLYEDKEKAVHHAIWLTFKNRLTGMQYGVEKSFRDLWGVVKVSDAKSESPYLTDTIRDYSQMSYDMIRKLRSDSDPSPPWEELIGAFSVLDGEILRYILYAKIPLEKLIRYELAIRGYDENHTWCGFEKAEKIWLK